MRRAALGTPLGPVWIEAQGSAITASGWGEAPRRTDDPLLTKALDQLSAYFEGHRQVFDLPLEHGRTGLSASVLSALAAIPFGETRSYGELSRALGAPAQAIGQACGANPLPILIPCHRVLGAKGLGGFSAPGGVEAKVWLLRHEGAAGLLI
jgi:methylated-DNA-[protein]-cysteine S-methyltransferase